MLENSKVHYIPAKPQREISEWVLTAVLVQIVQTNSKAFQHRYLILYK